MTVDEILKTVTVLKDSSIINFIAIFGTITMIVCIGVAIWHLGLAIKEKAIKAIITLTIVTLIEFAAMIKFEIVYYIEHPVYVDLYISTNGVKIDQISEYFKVDQLSQVDGITLCHITPKSEYYDEIVEAWRTGIEDAGSVKF